MNAADTPPLKITGNGSKNDSKKRASFNGFLKIGGFPKLFSKGIPSNQTERPVPVWRRSFGTRGRGELPPNPSRFSQILEKNLLQKSSSNSTHPLWIFKPSYGPSCIEASMHCDDKMRYDTVRYDEIQCDTTRYDTVRYVRLIFYSYTRQT